MLNPGSILGGRYQIIRTLGQGGMGEVYEATQMQLARRVALKTVRSDLAARPELLARFRREAESAAALGHPNLVQVTDFHEGTPGEPPFLVMEYLDGETVAQVLAREGRVPPPRAAFIAVQLLSGLAAAHRAGIVHRDVKPANIFLQSTTAMRDLVKVLDFGVAKLALDAAPNAKPMTQAGQVVGTLAYMAPEQALAGRTIDARTDIYGVGATLFHALAGVRPLEATVPGGGRAPLDQIAPWVSRDLAAIIERALHKEPDARWQTADEMAAALQPFSQSASVSSGSAPAAPSHVGWDPSAIGRMEAPTGGSSFGASQYGDPSLASAPTGYAGATGFDPSYAAAPKAPAAAMASLPFGSVSAYGPVGFSAPTAPSPGGYGPPPYLHTTPNYGTAAPPRKSGFPWWILIVGLIVLGGGVPYLISFLAIRNATNPDAIATNVEREVLKQPKQPCPAPDQCTETRKEHGLTYPICTRKLPRLSPYKPGEMVLAGPDTRIALVLTDPIGGNYTVRYLTKQGDETVSDADIVGRLCRAGGSRSGAAGQTIP
ncbi:MAG: serine/threonine protein kinase [Labilithrix sp.]|nr:serine/threonine protein kinase [Labilithrix sp.]